MFKLSRMSESDIESCGRSLRRSSESATFMERIPMIWRMVSQLGINTRQILRPDPVEVAETYDVFHVDEAVGSPYIPAQEEFVVPYGVRSVLGFGGLMSSGALFVVILFSKVHVSLSVAGRFSALALDVRASVEHFVDGPIYAEG